MRTTRHMTGTLLVLLTLLGGHVAAQEGTKHDDIQRLLKVMGARTIGLRVFNQVLAGFRRVHRDVPEAVWQEVRRDAEARVDSFVTEQLVPIYDQYLSHDDIKGLLAFYASPLGQKLLRVMPQMSEESMIAGQAWGREFAEAVNKRLAEKGYR